MGVITLTDRISVTVRAKSNTGGTGGSGASAQELATGRNAAKALGADPESISDEEAEALFDILNGGDGTGSSGASSSGTSKAITDEQGRQWLPISGIIAAGKRMYANGAFDEKEVHEGLTDSDGTVYNIENTVYTAPIVFYKYTGSDSNEKEWSVKNTSGNCYVTFDPGLHATCFSKESFRIKYETTGVSGWYDAEGASATINGIKYLFFTSGGSSSSTYNYNPDNVTVNLGPRPTNKQIAAYLFGSSHTTGGSLIDWTKPDDEIEDDIRNLHNTWDVTEHEGSATANGTYILAGPIEYNDADPSSPDPDEEE